MSVQNPIRDYPSLIREIASRRRSLGMSQIELDFVTGLADGHISKIERGNKRLGHVSLPCILKALNAAIVLVPDDKLQAVLEAMEGNAA